MESVTKVIASLFQGFIDSLKGTLALFYIDKSIKERARESSPRKYESSKPSPSQSAKKSPLPEGKILRRTLNCCALNGGLFWMSILLFQYGLLPLVRYFIVLLFGESSLVGDYSWTITESFLSIVFSTLWMLPLMLLSKVVNSIWFQDIADLAYRHTRGRPQLLSSFGKVFADVTFSFVIEGAFLIQTLLVSYFPVYPLGSLFALVHYAMLYSLYSFEYKMYNMGWKLHKRLYFIEANWPYFIGFGLPLALLTSLASSYVVSGCIFSILFPLFIISANEAAPVRDSSAPRLQLFSPVIALSNAIFYRSIAPLSVSRSQQASSTFLSTTSSPSSTQVKTSTPSKSLNERKNM